jgi:hypothetical protein
MGVLIADTYQEGAGSFVSNRQESEGESVVVRSVLALVGTEEQGIQVADNSMTSTPELKLKDAFELLRTDLPDASKFVMIPDFIALEMWHTEEGYVAVLEILSEYGYGDTSKAAMHALWSKLEEYYSMLEGSEDTLSDALGSELAYLRTIMRPHDGNTD